MVILAIAGAFWSVTTAKEHVVAYISEVVGPQGVQAVEMILSSRPEQGSSVVATCVGVGVLLFGATAMFAELQSALNTIWSASVRPRGTMGGFVRRRLISFAILIVMCALLVVSVLISTGMNLVMARVPGGLPGSDSLWQLASVAVFFCTFALLFAAAFKFLPDAKIRWSDVWIGGAVTSALFLIGKELVGFYLGRASVASSYGIGASLVALLAWLYYCSVIFFVGAEFTHALATHIRTSGDHPVQDFSE